MAIKYLSLLTLFALTLLPTYAEDRLTVVFSGSTNLTFTVLLKERFGERPYDATLEYPSEYKDGRPSKFDRAGIGYFISAKIIKETEYGARFTIKIDKHNLIGWTDYQREGDIIRQPIFSSFSTDTEIELPTGEWVTLEGKSGEDKEQPTSVKLLYKK